MVILIQKNNINMVILYLVLSLQSEYKRCMLFVMFTSTDPLLSVSRQFNLSHVLTMLSVSSLCSISFCTDQAICL